MWIWSFALLYFARIHRVVVKCDLALMIIVNAGSYVEGDIKALLRSLIEVAEAHLAVWLAEYILIF